MSNVNLVSSLKALIASPDNISLSDDALILIKENLVHFNISADEMIDIKRMPPDITDLDSLFRHLRSIKSMIEADNQLGNVYERNRDGHIQGKKPVYMSDGSLKRYKLAICCLHALSNWSDVNREFRGSISEHVATIGRHASAHSPPGLAAGALKLWTVTFTEMTPRTKSMLAMILKFSLQPVA
jgi:hypothetical protein